MLSTPRSETRSGTVRVLLAHSRYRLRGGEERHLELLERGLTELGVKVGRYERVAPPAPSIAGRLSIATSMLYSRKVAAELEDLVETEGYDVVHVHNMLPMLSPSALVGARRGGAAVVLTAHNYRLFCPLGTMFAAGRPHRSCIRGSSLVCAVRHPRDDLGTTVAYGVGIEVQRRLRLVERWADAVVAPSRFLARTLVSAGFDPTLVRALSYGVPVRPFRSLPRDYVLFAGRLSEEKGLGLLLTASKLVPDIPIVVAGGGPLRPLVDGQRGDNVRFVGSLSEDEVAEVRASAALVVVPSVWDDVQPFSAIEALAAGKPVLTSDRGGLPEIVAGGGGMTFESGNVSELAQGLRTLWAASRSSVDVGREAWQVANRRHSLRTQTAKLLRLYQEVVDVTGTRRRSRYRKNVAST